MKRIFNIIRTDLITMNGGKNEMKGLMILMIVIITAGTFFLSPIIAVYFPFIFGAFFVPTLFKNEMKYNCEKMYSIIPLERKDLVNGRYLFVCTLYTAANFIFYLLTLLSQSLHIFVEFIGDNGEKTDIIRLITERMGDSFSAFGLLTLLYAGSFCIGLKLIGIAMLKYFRSGAARFQKMQTASVTGSFKRTKEEKRELTGSVIFIFIMLFLFFGIMTDLLPIGELLTVIMTLFVRIASHANGFLLSAVFIAMAIMGAVFKYFKTRFAYEKRDI